MDYLGIIVAVFGGTIALGNLISCDNKSTKLIHLMILILDILFTFYWIFVYQKG